MRKYKIQESFFKFLLLVIRPKSKNEELARREFILNTLLIGFFILSAIAVISGLINFRRIEQIGEFYNGIPLLITFSISLIFIALYFFSRAGLSAQVAYIFITIVLLVAGYMSYVFGANVPQALLMFALVIILSGILVSTKFSFFITIFSLLYLLSLGFFQTKGVIAINTLWKTKMFHMGDILVYVFTLSVLTIVSWLSNREIERALKRAMKSEENLRKERDMLEVNVAEKTKQLQLVWEKKRVNLQEFASIGRHTVGVIHDLVTPLTTLSLNLKMFKNINHSRLISKATQASEQIEQYIERTRNRIDNKDAQTYFFLSKEISRAKKSVAGKARSARVKITLPKTNLDAFGNPFSFYQLTLNLLDNAIDSYAGSQNKKREVLVDIKQNKQHVFLTVTDSGQGIAFRDLKRIFDPFFTTKGSAGKMGIGLAICKEIVEKDFGGTISVKSKLNQGTTFVIKLPIVKKRV